MKIKPYLTYLAGPYSAVDVNISSAEYVKEARFAALTRAAAWLMNEHSRWNVFSPITHSHPLHTIAGMEGDWKFWSRIDTQYIRLSKRLVVLTLDGWRGSVGVQAERKIARRFGVPIFYMDPVSYELSKQEPTSK